MQGDVKSKPILFNTAMVQAILDGRKTVTRRVVKPKPYPYGPVLIYDGVIRTKEGVIKRAPYQVGDVLWVRETWCDWPDDDGHNYFYKATDDGVDGFSPKWKPSIHMPREAARIFLKVTDVRVERLQDITNDQAEKEGVPTDWPMAAVFCPECKGEGVLGTYDSRTLGYVEIDCYHCGDATERFKNLWNSTIKKKDLDEFGWDANPWVWVIEFERCENEE